MIEIKENFNDTDFIPGNIDEPTPETVVKVMNIMKQLNADEKFFAYCFLQYAYEQLGLFEDQVETN